MERNTQTLEWSNGARIAATVLFCISICLPGIATIFHFSPHAALIEKRDRVEFPTLAQWSPRLFEEAYNDHFGLRDSLVLGHNWISTFVWGVSPTKSAIIGKQGWLYYGASIDDYRGSIVFSKKLIDLWRQEFTAKQAFLSAHHIAYVVAIAPGKESIYPEYLPSHIQQIRRRTCLDQFSEALHGPQSFEWIDLRAILLAKKRESKEPLFLRTDTHWSDTGAMFAASEIISRLGTQVTGLPAIDPNTYWQIEISGLGGDLAEMIGFPKELRETSMSLIPNDAVANAVPPAEWVGSLHMPAHCFETVGPDRTRRALMCGDSFGVAITQLLAPQFQRFVYLRKMPDAEDYDAALAKIVEQEHPEVVIELFTERNLLQAPTTVFKAP
jgi:hypothetical protein